MGRKELRRPLPAEGIEVLPDLDRGPGVVAGLGHVDQADLVGFGFLGSGIGQDDPEGGRLGRELRPLDPGRGADGLGAGLYQHLLADPLGAVFGQHVGDFMRHNGGQLMLGLDHLEQAGVHADLASGQGEGIGIGVLEEDELPGKPRLAAHVGDTSAGPLHRLAEPGIAGDAGLGLDLLIGVDAHLVGLAVGQEDELLAAGHRRGFAGGEQRQGAEETDASEELGAWQRHKTSPLRAMAAAGRDREALTAGPN